jgi:mediator of RNA polymerase II transcription subunit 8, fungi type
MASLGLSQEEFKGIEQTRQRLFQLSKGIESLRTDMLNNNPLPSTCVALFLRATSHSANPEGTPRRSSLQASAQILQRNMQSLLAIVNDNADVFRRLAVHPSANFPGRTQENILLMLLRKKLEPEVEEWVAQGRETSEAITADGLLELEMMWSRLRQWCKDRIKEYVVDEASELYTTEEREMGIENVQTGLKRQLVDDEDEDEEDEDEDEDRPPPQALPAEKGPEPEALFWFADVGDELMPRNVELDSRKKVVAGGIPGLGK